MKAVVMAGGEGSRLRPLTLDLPKPLAPIANKPVMHHIVDLLRSHGMTEVLSTIHYKGEAIERYFGNGSAFGVRMSYVREESPLGTAGAVGLAREALADDTFLIISGDALTDIDLRALVDDHRASGAMATIAVRRMSDPREFGVVETDATGRIVRFQEKPSWSEAFSDTINTGIYVLEPCVLDLIPAGEMCDFAKDVFPRMLAEGHLLRACTVDGYWSDVGTLEQYKAANDDALYGRVRLELPGLGLRPGIRCGSGCTIHPEAVLQAPLVLGNDVFVGAGAHVECAAIGDGTVVGAGSVVTRSVIWRGTQLDEHADIQACVLADDLLVGARACIETGAVIGRGCRIAADATIKQGLTMWPLRTVAEGAVVSMSMVHRVAWPQSLFGDDGVRGIANLEIDSQFAARLGEAFGSALQSGATAVVGTDSHNASRVIAASIVSGLRATGVHVMQAIAMPAPVVRAAVRSSGEGGLYVRSDPDEPSMLLLEFIDERGANASRALQRKIEGIFARDEFRKASIDRIGAAYENNHKLYALYGLTIAGAIAPPQPGPSIHAIVNMTNSRMEEILAKAFERSGVDIRFLKSTSVERLGEVVRERGAHCGFHFDESGERVMLVDERGQTVESEDLLSFCALLVCRMAAHARIAVPVKASSAIDTLGERYGAAIARTSNAASTSMALVMNAEPAFSLASYDGSLPVFAESSAIPDAFFAAIRIAQLLRAQAMSVSEIAAMLPALSRARQSVSCPPERKIGIMRLLRETLPGAETATAGGLRVRSARGWALVLPDATEPSFTVVGEAETSQDASELVDEVARRIERLAAA